jgi:putative Mn2+ efflux pump MntP
METTTIIGIALGLAMDAFAVSIACSTTLRKVSVRQTFRIGFHFGLFQGLMPVIGWLAGSTANDYIVHFDHWIAFGLLLLVGVKAIYEAWSLKGTTSRRGDPTRGMSLVVYSIATSIDALAIGISLAMLNVDIWYPSLIIGVITAIVSAAGMVLGTTLGTRFGSRIEVLGGIILIGIGINILVSHLG